MTNKVTVTKEQAEAIEKGIKVHGEDYLVDSHCLKQKNRLTWGGHLKELNNIEMWKLARAVHRGYKIEPEFNVGDVVIFEFKDAVCVMGEIVEIEVEEVTFAKIDDPKYQVPQKINISELRHATTQEIKQEKERRFWSGLGREANEYKIGDVVSTGSVTRPIEAVWNDGELSLEGLGVANPYTADEIFLVCPVEKRLDANE